MIYQIVLVYNSNDAEDEIGPDLPADWIHLHADQLREVANHQAGYQSWQILNVTPTRQES